MQKIFQQLEALFLGAIPTTLLFVVLVVAYQLLVQGPLSAILRERRARTTGAIEDARNAIAEAETKAADYAARLRQARAAAYKVREQRLQQWIVERDAAVDVARKAADQQVSQARSGIDAELGAARQQIESSVGELAGQVMRAVLPAAAGGSR